MFSIFLLRKFHFGILLTLLLFSFQQISFSQSLLAPSSQTKFLNKLPVIKEAGLRVDLTKGGNLNVEMVQTTQDLGLQGITSYNGSTVWAYKFPDLPATYPGATIVAKKNKKVFIEWQNNLPGHFLPVDASLHMAHPNSINTIDGVRTWYGAGNVPTVAHLHGGHTESASDGLPEAWFTKGFVATGDYFVKQQYKYDNKQESATLWYHDHALGITRLNVYAGLAGFYLLRDDNEEKLISQNVLPGGDYEIEIVVQDRSFDDNGQLFWPGNPDDPSVFFGTEEWNAWDDFINGAVSENGGDPALVPRPSALAEFFGDFILVNGMAWPKLEVEPRKYRFRLLNGSDARFYVLEFRDNETGIGTGRTFMQIGTDDGLLPKPVELTQLLIAPGERMDLVVDFTELEGEQIYLRNFGPDDPYGGGIPGDGSFTSADVNSTGQIMMFDVSQTFDETIPNAKVKVQSRLRPNIMPLVQEGATRNLVLFEGSDEYGRLMPMLGTLADGSLTWSDAITENPMKNDTEVWEVYNATGDAHPIHLHLVSFQIINRESFTTNGDDEPEVHSKPQELHNGEWGTGFTLNEADIVLGGDARDPEDNEKGWKDTAVMLPGEVTRVIARFDLEGRYVWHCHILSHEDHEMMRPFYVGTMPLPKQSGDVIAGVTEFRLDQNYPNPFNPSTTINFTIPQNTQVTLKIFDVLGKEISTLIHQIVPSGNHEVQFDATGLPSGVYFYNLTAGNFVENKKMILLK
jgi:spore coat protein A